MLTKFTCQLIRIEAFQRLSKKIYSENSSGYSFSFANGGDQFKDNIPEINICKDLGIKLIDGLGEKIQSSSWILKNK